MLLPIGRNFCRQMVAFIQFFILAALHLCTVIGSEIRLDQHSTHYSDCKSIGEISIRSKHFFKNL
jgi:hypothetical protein